MSPASATAPMRSNVREFPRDRSSDADLVAAVARGDQDALAVIWRRHASAVRSTLIACLGPDHAVDDLLQNVFITLLRTAGQLRDPSALRSYLLGAAVRSARSERRARSRRARWLSIATLASRDARVEPQVEERDTLRLVMRLLERLPDRAREAFVLRYVQRVPQDEVARALGVSLATAKRDIALGRDRMLRLAASEPSLAQYLAAFEGEP